MAKDTTKTRKRVLELFHEILRAKRTQESNPSVIKQQCILQKKMRIAKKKALREQREKQAEIDKQVKPVFQKVEDGYIDEPKGITYEDGRTASTFKEIIKHGF